MSRISSTLCAFSVCLSLFLVTVEGRGLGGGGVHFMPSIIRLIDVPLELPDHPLILLLHRLPSKQMGPRRLGIGGGRRQHMFPFTLPFPNFKLWLVVTPRCNSSMVP